MEPYDVREAMAERSWPCREVLRSKTRCPGCDIAISRHALLYKHRCPRVPGSGDPETKRRRLQERMDARIAAKFQAAPGPAPEQTPDS